MDKNLWGKTINPESCPRWLCASCLAGQVIMDTASFHDEETGETRRDRKSGEFENEWTKSIFTVRAHCNNSDCEQMYVISGHGSVDHGQIGDEEWGYIRNYEIYSILPALNIIYTPPNTPQSVIRQLSDSFLLYWVNGASCAQKIRIAVESLMDELHVNSKRTLDARLKEYEKIEPIKAKQLLAIKWFGNTAAHEGAVQNRDILAAYSILEHVLEEIYGTKISDINRSVEALNLRHKR